MKATVLGLLLLPLFIAISEVKSERTVKLCGREFVRAVVFTCGGSRWRRQLSEDFPEDNYPFLSCDVNYSAGGNENVIQNPEVKREEFLQPNNEARRALWNQKEMSVQKRQDDLSQLTMVCCTIGCSETNISSLC
uniref:Insulin like 5 n=1 Tax=Salvator merianae TaxID=96440 RepID=A0A8D0E2W8_SALMN